MGMGEMTNSYKILLGKPEGNRSFWRHRYRRDGNIKIDIKEVFPEKVDWNCLLWDRPQWRGVVNTVKKLLGF
jgi:hypothetical protein